MAKKSSEKIKYIALAGLGAILLFTLVYQLFFTGPAPRPTLQSGKRGANSNARGGVVIQTPENAQSATTRQSTSGKANDQEMMRLLLDDPNPLEVRFMATSGPAAVSPRGNIFEYYVPPPIIVPPTPPPPPPPIALQGVSPQNATAGTPRPFTLTVVGQNIPADAKIYMDGNQRPTKRLNETTLTTDMAPADYSVARNSTIEVKSPTDPAMFSNPLTFTTIALQEPPIKFIGLLGEQALIEVPATKEFLRLKVGDTFQRVWRVDSISTQDLGLTQTQFDIKKRIPLQAKPR
jgi:hypothetical protein